MDTDNNGDKFGQVSTVKMSEKSPCAKRMSHHIFSKGAWRRARLAAHPLVKLNISSETNSSLIFGIEAVADSGAQSDVWSFQEYLNAGFSELDLQRVNLSRNAENKSPIDIQGAFIARLTGVCHDGTPHAKDFSAHKK